MQYDQQGLANRGRAEFVSSLRGGRCFEKRVARMAQPLQNVTRVKA